MFVISRILPAPEQAIGTLIRCHHMRYPRCGADIDANKQFCTRRVGTGFTSGYRTGSRRDSVPRRGAHLYWGVAAYGISSPRAPTSGSLQQRHSRRVSTRSTTRSTTRFSCSPRTAPPRLSRTHSASTRDRDSAFSTN